MSRTKLMRPQRLFLLIFPRSSSAPSSYCLFLFAQILSFLLYIPFPFSLNIDSLGDPVALRRRRTRRQSVRRCAEDPQSVVRRTKDQRRRGPQAHSDSGVAAPRCPFKSHQLIGCRLGQSTFHFSLNLLQPFFFLFPEERVNCPARIYFHLARGPLRRG